LIGQTQESEYCRPCLDKMLNARKINAGKRVLCFLSTKCKYCKLAAQRINVMAKKSNDYKRFAFVLWDDYHDSNRFYHELNIYPFKSMEMNVLDFLDLTKGVMPLILLYDNGQVVGSYRYADMDEDRIMQFLQAE